MLRSFIAILFLFVAVPAMAQRTSIEEYISQFRDIAMSEMKRSGVPASITLAQGILESENGNSELVKKSNNHFGIKCKNTWLGESVTHDDDATGECFRAYNNAGDSYRDHSDFLRANKRYSALFALDPADYAGWAKGLKKAGYATNPRYPDLLIKYIEQYDLQQYSLAVLGQSQQSDLAKIDGPNLGNIPPEFKEALTADPKPIANNFDEITSINKTKCVFVKKGTSLLLVANKFNISLHKLMDFNDLEKEGILAKDQYIYLSKKQKQGEEELYLVRPGETLYDVAQNTGVQLKHLAGYNQLGEKAQLIPNTKLALQPGVQADIKTAGEKKQKVHLVAPKEGLYAIARTYNVSVQQLKEWNKLDSDNLKIGQEIIVSQFR